jgi:hypothetical protein
VSEVCAREAHTHTHTHTHFRSFRSNVIERRTREEDEGEKQPETKRRKRDGNLVLDSCGKGQRPDLDR